MNASQNAVELIKRHEGLRLTAYYDSVGVLTIGYGSTVDVEPGQRITQAEAEDRLREDMNDAEVAVNALVTVPLTQNEFDALTSLVFNIGRGNFAKSTLLRVLNEGKHDLAANEIRRWDRAGGQVLAGLTKRRWDEQKLFETA